MYQDEWGWIKEYYIKYKGVPPAEEFKKQFPDYVTYNTDASIEFYIEELHKFKAERVMAELLVEATKDLRQHGPFNAMNLLNRHLSILGRDTKMVRDLDLVGNHNERLDNLWERIKLLESGKKLIGIPTGFKTIDQEFGGWQNGDLIVIAAWTGQGKSWMGLYTAVNAWREGHRVLYFSLEMSSLQIGYRFDTLLGAGQFSNSGLTHANDIVFDRYKSWLGESMKNKQPFVVVTNEDLDEINQNTVLSKIEQWKPDLVVLDYHHLFDDASGVTGETEKTKNLSKAFKRIALRTGVPIVDITSVTMKDDHGERPPELHELGWSKQLAYDSDLTLALCKHGNQIETVARKNRRGKEFKFFLNWNFDSGQVHEIVPTRIIREENDGEYNEANN